MGSVVEARRYLNNAKEILIEKPGKKTVITRVRSTLKWPGILLAPEFCWHWAIFQAKKRSRVDHQLDRNKNYDGLMAYVYFSKCNNTNDQNHF